MRTQKMGKDSKTAGSWMAWIAVYSQFEVVARFPSFLHTVFAHQYVQVVKQSQVSYSCTLRPLRDFMALGGAQGIGWDAVYE